MMNCEKNAIAKYGYLHTQVTTTGATIIGTAIAAMMNAKEGVVRIFILPATSDYLTAFKTNDMVLISELCVIVIEYGIGGVWKNALFTKQEADDQLPLAISQTNKKCEIKTLEAYHTELVYSYY